MHNVSELAKLSKTVYPSVQCTCISSDTIVVLVHVLVYVYVYKVYL